MKLRNLQLKMQSMILHGVQDDDFVISGPRLTGKQGLQIYNRAYHARLKQCLRKEYPVLLHALGEELFGKFTLAYLEEYPPNSYTLADLGARFPQFLKETRPSGEWPDFFIDLAVLERTFFEVFDQKVSRTRLLKFNYPVNTYFLKVRKGQRPPLPSRKKTFLAVYRKDDIVKFRKRSF